MNSLTGALAAARRGWPVFPLRQGEKRPRVTEWETVATTSPDRIWWWWRRHPDDNVAIATGPAGLVVVDLDLAGPDEEPPAEHPGARGGLDVFAALAAEHGYVSGDKGQPLAAWTAGRYRKNAHTCIRRAVELGRLPVTPGRRHPGGATAARPVVSARRWTCAGFRTPTPWRRS